MALTITEKQHWKDRIESRISKRIKRLKSGNHEFFSEISEKAKQQAIAQSKLAKDFDRLAVIEKTESELENEKEVLLVQMHNKLIGKSYASYGVRDRISTRINELQREIEDELLGESDIGREIASLLAEKENLLDTIWLATSPRQVTELW